MPPLLLDDDEAIAIAVGLRTAARASVTGIEETAVRALVKLEQVLPAHLRRRVSALGSATIDARRVGGPTVDPQAPDRDRRRLPRPRAPALRLPRAATAPRAGARSSRTSLVNLGRRWYLVAWDRGREDWRTFRVDRLDAPAATGVRFAPRALPAQGRRRRTSRASITGAPNRYEARVTLHAPAEEMREPRARAAAARSSRSTTSAASTAPATTTSTGWRCAIAMLGVDFEVHEPPELIEHLQALADRLERAVRP